LRAPLRGNPPSFMIIGAQKAGTTSLYHYLNLHPDLVGSEPKEIHYFDKWINYGYPLKWYESHFKFLFPANKLFFEATPNYIYFESVARYIQQHYPGIKLILILRNPVDRAYSAWNMYYELFKSGIDFIARKGKSPDKPNYTFEYLIKGKKRFPTFREAIEIELDLSKNNISEPAILRRGIYVEQIKAYLKYFKLEQMLIIGFHELVDNVQQVLDKVYQFLSIEGHTLHKKSIVAKNKRSYEQQLSKHDRIFLDNYYSAFNQELIRLIKKELHW